MLKNFRDASNKPVAKVLMGILVFSFVGWGASSWIFGESGIDDVIVKIGRESVTMKAFEQERGRQMAALSREQQKQIYTDRATGVYFSQQILSKLASQLMLEQRAKYMGLAVTNAAVANAIRTEPAFQQDGKFSAVQFDSVLAMNGLSESTFAEHIRRTLLRDMVLSGVAGGIHVPDFTVTAMHNARHAKRDIEFATVRFEDFKVAGQPTDEQLRDTYAKNPKTIPEFRTVSYVLVTPDSSNPDAMDGAYATAQKIEDAVISGDSMGDAAAKHKAKFTLLPLIGADWKTKSGVAVADSVLNDVARAAAWRMEEGTESEIFETKSGFVILRVEKIVHAHAADMEEVRPELIHLWKIAEQRKQAYEKANGILIAANKDGKSVGKQVSVTRASGAPLEVLSAAFSLPVGTKTIIPAGNAFYVLYVINSSLPKMDAAAGTALSREAAAMLSRTIRDDYSAFLSRKYPTKINNRLFKRLFGEN